MRILVDIVKRENSIEQINQEGFVFKVFNSSSEPKCEETTDQTKYDVPNINEEVIDNLPTVVQSYWVFGGQPDPIRTVLAKWCCSDSFGTRQP